MGSRKRRVGKSEKGKTILGSTSPLVGKPHAGISPCPHSSHSPGHQAGELTPVQRHTCRRIHHLWRWWRPVAGAKLQGSPPTLRNRAAKLVKTADVANMLLINRNLSVSICRTLGGVLVYRQSRLGPGLQHLDARFWRAAIKKKNIQIISTIFYYRSISRLNS